MDLEQTHKIYIAYGLKDETKLETEKLKDR